MDHALALGPPALVSQNPVRNAAVTIHYPLTQTVISPQLPSWEFMFHLLLYLTAKWFVQNQPKLLFNWFALLCHVHHCVDH